MDQSRHISESVVETRMPIGTDIFTQHISRDLSSATPDPVEITSVKRDFCRVSAQSQYARSTHVFRWTEPGRGKSCKSKSGHTITMQIESGISLRRWNLSLPWQLAVEPPRDGLRLPDTASHLSEFRLYQSHLTKLRQKPVTCVTAGLYTPRCFAVESF